MIPRTWYKAVSRRPTERVNSVTRTSRNSDPQDTIEEGKEIHRLARLASLSEREGRKKEPYRANNPGMMTVALDRATYQGVLRFLADNLDTLRGPGHACGQLIKAKLSDLSYLYEKSPLEDVETVYKRTLREQAEHARASEIYNIRDSWTTLSDKAKRFWLDRYPELGDLPAPVPKHPT